MPLRRLSRGLFVAFDLSTSKSVPTSMGFVYIPWRNFSTSSHEEKIEMVEWQEGARKKLAGFFVENFMQDYEVNVLFLNYFF